MNFQRLYTINCDLGEGVPNEAAVIPWIDVASIACGGHFGDHDSIRASLQLIKTFGKKAGAHPSYPDLANFGRKTLSISHKDLINSVKKQIHFYTKVAKSAGIPLDHIKFHGALYNDAAGDRNLAEQLAIFLRKEYLDTPILVPPHSELETAALNEGLPIRLEIFGDRAYQNNYQLVDRKDENSLFTETDQVISHLDSIFGLGQIKTYTGDKIPIESDTLCFHGDNPGILKFLPLVRERFWR